SVPARVSKEGFPMSSTSPQVLPAGWTEVMEKAQQQLQQAVAASVEREKAVDCGGPATPEMNQEGITRQLDKCQEGIRRLETSVKAAEQKAEEADTDLRASEEGIQGWLTSAAALRQRLANWEVPQV